MPGFCVVWEESTLQYLCRQKITINHALRLAFVYRCCALFRALAKGFEQSALFWENNGEI